MAKIYLSVGSGLNQRQEDFVQALERRIEASGMSTHTVGRNEFSTDAPLIAVKTLMDKCDGAIVLGLERLRFPEGIERPDSERMQNLGATSIATPWNQIEATLAYERKLPLLVLVDASVRQDGMLEPKNDWYVETITLQPGELDSKEFIGRFRHFLSKVEESLASVQADGGAALPEDDLSARKIGDWIKEMTPGQVWGVLTSTGAALTGSFALGFWLGGL